MRTALARSFSSSTFAAALGLAAGSAAAAGTPVTFQLNWMAGGPNAGFAAALAEGYYRDAGLDVTIVQGNGSGNTAQPRRQRPRAARVPRTRRGEPAHRQGRTDEDHRHGLPVEPERR
jgi:hypothetical protein